MTSTAQIYGYVRASSLSPSGLLDLQTSGGVTTAGPAAHPRFFSGFLGEAEPAAAALLGVANVAQARYWRRDLAALRDPVVTCNGDRLRFESFSGCCGVYARLDVLDDGMDGTALDRGTTNVDVNNDLRLALARVRGGDPLRLEVGPEGLQATTFDGTVVERKVPLPARWLRGFAEVQAVTSGYDLRAELGAADAARFLRGLPSAPRGVQWLVPAGRTLRLAASAGPGAVCLAGPQRLKELLPLLRFGGKLRVYGPNVARGANPVASVWQLDADRASTSSRPTRIGGASVAWRTARVQTPKPTPTRRRVRDECRRDECRRDERRGDERGQPHSADEPGRTGGGGDLLQRADREAAARLRQPPEGVREVVQLERRD